MAVSPHQFRQTTSSSIRTAAPNQTNFLQQLQTALQGGDAVYNFFASDSQQLQNFYQTIGTSDDTIWLDGTDDSGNPVSYVQIGDNYLTISGCVNDVTPLQNGTGTDYKPIGATVVTLTIGGTTQQLTESIIEYSGEGLGGVIIGAAIISQIIKYNNLVRLTYISKYGDGSVYFVESNPPQTGDDADNAADGISNEAAQQAEQRAIVMEGVDATADFSVSAEAIGGAAVGAFLILIMVLLQIIEKQLTNFAKFYNVTNEDIQFGICTVPQGESSKGPAPVGQTATIAKVSPGQAPPGIISAPEVIQYSFLSFVNSNPLTSIGYILEALPNSTTGFPGFRVGVYVDGNSNTLYIALTNDDCNAFWNDFNPYNENNPNPTGQSTLTLKATSGRYTLQIALNQLSGQSPSPLDATQGYNFEHLIVLTDGSIPLS